MKRTIHPSALSLRGRMIQRPGGTLWRCRSATNLKQFGNKNGRFSRKTCHYLCHCEERSDVAIFKPKAWHPVAKHGGTKQEGIPITKNMRYAASFRLAIFRYGMTNRIVKDCHVGRTRPPRNDKIERFCGKTERFSERKVSNFSGVIPHEKGRLKQKRSFSK